jgi:hypothetical protein
MSDDDKAARHSKIIDLLALFAQAKPRPGFRKPAIQTPDPIDDDAHVQRPRVSEPMPLTADEAEHFRDMPLDARGAPHVRSQLASYVAREANGDTGRVHLYSFDEDINARHYIARYERAGVSHLAESYRKILADYRAKEEANGKPFEKCNPYIVADCESEALMQRMYDSPEKDRARLIQHHRRAVEINTASRRDLPSRYSRHELI